jgi:DNA ligase-1
MNVDTISKPIELEESKNMENNLLEPVSTFDYDTMYALSKSGKLRIYTLKVEDYGDHADIVTTSRLGDTGKATEDRKSVYTGVNIGKSNETTYLEQAFRIANSKVSKLRDQGFSETRPDTSKKFNTDANGEIKPMLAIPFDEKQIKYPCLCQPKYDGVRCTVSVGSDGEVKIISRQGKPYTIPQLSDWAEEHRDTLPLDGELYNHGELSFQEITSAVKKQSEMTKMIKYVIYDRPVYGEDNSERWGRLLDMNDRGIFDNSPVYLSTYKICYDMDEVREYHRECVADGYEGVIIRNFDAPYEFGFRSRNLIKLKDFEDSEFTIVDVVEGTGRDAGTAVFELSLPDSRTFKARPVGEFEKRKEYFDRSSELIGKQCTVKYQGMSDDGVPRFPVAIAVRDYE